MIKAINFLGNPEPAANVANVQAPQAENKSAEALAMPQAPAMPQEPAQDTFVPSAPKTEEAPKADPNDKFVKADDKKSEED